MRKVILRYKETIWYTGAEVEYSRKYRLGRGSGLVGEGVI